MAVAAPRTRPATRSPWRRSTGPGASPWDARNCPCSSCCWMTSRTARRPSPDIAKATFQMLNDYLPEAQRPKKVAIFQEKTDWGKELGDLWMKEAAAHGYQIVLQAEYAVGSKDFSDIILRAKNAGAETLLSLPNPPDGMAIVKQMQELDYTPRFP